VKVEVKVGRGWGEFHELVWILIGIRVHGWKGERVRVRGIIIKFNMYAELKCGLLGRYYGERLGLVGAEPGTERKKEEEKMR